MRAVNRRRDVGDRRFDRAAFGKEAAFDELGQFGGIQPHAIDAGDDRRQLRAIPADFGVDRLRIDAGSQPLVQPDRELLAIEPERDRGSAAWPSRLFLFQELPELACRQCPEAGAVGYLDGMGHGAHQQIARRLQIYGADAGDLRRHRQLGPDRFQVLQAGRDLGPRPLAVDDVAFDLRLDQHARAVDLQGRVVRRGAQLMVDLVKPAVKLTVIERQRQRHALTRADETCRRAQPVERRLLAPETNDAVIGGVGVDRDANVAQGCRPGAVSQGKGDRRRFDFRRALVERRGRVGKGESPHRDTGDRDGREDPLRKRDAHREE